MKAIIVGADGTIGRALVAALKTRGDIVFATSRRPNAERQGYLHLDLADPSAVVAHLPKADIAFFCAAITGFAECRRNPELACMVNTTAPLTLAERLLGMGTHVVLLSTSAVFDWRTPHVPALRPPCPVSLYGKMKAEAETGFLALGSRGSVVRFAKVLEPAQKLLTGWIEALAHRRPIEAFTDLRMAPISVDDAIKALIAVADDAGGGIYQLSGASDISYFEAAIHLARRLARDSRLVTAARAIDSGIPAEEITIFSSLDSSRLAALTGHPPPDPLAVIDATFAPAIARLARSETAS